MGQPVGRGHPSANTTPSWTAATRSLRHLELPFKVPCIFNYCQSVISATMKNCKGKVSRHEA